MIFPSFYKGVGAIYSYSRSRIYPAESGSDYYVQNRAGQACAYHEMVKVWMYQYDQYVELASSLSGDRNFAMSSAGFDLS